MAEFKFYMFFVWAAAMVLAIWAVEVARMFARRVGKEAARREQLRREPPVQDPRSPAVAVILPIKGVDEQTEVNVRALLEQAYPNYRLLFSVESGHDPVVPVLERLAGESGKRVEIVVAGLARERGQKIHNQLAAVDRTDDRDEILVFMDADARPKTQWLADLVGPLRGDSSGAGEIGATTGFRFYVPVEGAGASLTNAMVSVINAGVAALLGPGWRNIAWGGSMAIRRKDFCERMGVRQAWQHALSDDYVLSYCVKNRSKKKIQFVQGCLVASAADFDWPSFWEFAARQYRITKVCAPGVWLTAIGASLLYLVAMVYTLAFWIGSLAAGTPDHPLIFMFLGVYIANALRGYLLLEGGRLAMDGAEPRRALKRIWFWYTLGYPVTLAVNLLALLRSAWGRRITWRGVTYVMHNRLETTVVGTGDSQPGLAIAAGSGE